MKILSAARNVINSEEISAWLAHEFADITPALGLWINSTVRKWILKNAPIVNAPKVDTKGMPEFLRRAFNDPNAVPPQNVTLDDTLRLRIQQVLDYMTDLVSVKPETNVASIGFDVAENRAKKWHADMRVSQERLTPASEDGTKVVMQYPDGWSWREVDGEAAMNREGELMGHCVGNFGYYQQVLRAKTKIISLRDAKNHPHVTIETRESTQSVRQIRGANNAAVVPKYLSRVADFLNSRVWRSIAFDGASPIEQQVREYQMLHAPAIHEAHGVRAVYSLKSTLSDHEIVHFVHEQKVVAKADYRKAKSLKYLSVVDGETLALASMVREWCVTEGLRIDAPTSNVLMLGTNWTSHAQGWCEAGNVAAQQLCKIVGNADTVCLLSDVVVAWTTGQTLVFDGGLSTETKRELSLSCGMTPETVLVAGDWTEAFKPAPTIQAWIAKHRAGKTVRQGTDLELLDSLLAALKQPTAQEIKAAYRRIKDVDELTDQKVKGLGFPTSGRSINAIGAVLLCSLPVQNAAPFKRWVFSKPNTLNCWQEVVSTPDHLSNSLRSYGLSDVVVHKVLELLRNEFLRLTPTLEELEGLDLDAGIEMRVRKGIQYAAAHRTDKQRSKALWSQL